MTRLPASRYVPLLVVGLVLAFPLWGCLTTPTLTLESEAPTTMTVEEAEQVILDRYNELADPGCRSADTESAIVKIDGTTDVARIPTDDVLAAAQAGDVWVLGWCESEGVTA